MNFRFENIDTSSNYIPRVLRYIYVCVCECVFGWMCVGGACVQREGRGRELETERERENIC